MGLNHLSKELNWPMKSWNDIVVSIPTVNYFILFFEKIFWSTKNSTYVYTCNFKLEKKNTYYIPNYNMYAKTKTIYISICLLYVQDFLKWHYLLGLQALCGLLPRLTVKFSFLVCPNFFLREMTIWRAVTYILLTILHSEYA